MKRRSFIALAWASAAVGMGNAVKPTKGQTLHHEAADTATTISFDMHFDPSPFDLEQLKEAADQMASHSPGGAAGPSSDI